jgi:hypothetical protein
LCAQVVGEINVQEAPGFPELGTRHLSGLGTSLEGVGVKPEEFRGFLEVEGAHQAVLELRSSAAIRLSWRQS